MKKNLILIIVLAALSNAKLFSEAKNLNLVSFWTAVLHSRKIIDNPEFKKHAEENLQRVKSENSNYKPSHSNKYYK